MKIGANMHFLKIAGEKYGADELSNLTGDGLSCLGLNSFQSIDVDTRTNSIAIVFEREDDSSAAWAIAGSKQPTCNKVFRCNNVSKFILHLHCIITALGNPV